MKKIGKYILNNFLFGLAWLIKRAILANISFFILKKLEKWGFVKSFWKLDEQYYLSTYTTILFAVEILAFFIVGLLLEWQIKRWINRNIEEVYTSKVSEVSSALKEVFKFVVYKTKVISIETLKNLKKPEISKEEKKEFSKEITKGIKEVSSIVVLGLITITIEGSGIFTYTIVGVLFVGVLAIFSSALVLMYIFIENLDRILGNLELCIKAIVRRNNKSEVEVIDKH